MGKRIVYEGGAYISMDAKALMLVQRSQKMEYPITIKDFFINGKKYDIAGKPFVSFGKVMALPGQWDIYEDDLHFRAADIASLIEKSDFAAPAAKGKTALVATPGGDKPWLIPNPQDPKPIQPWYIPARYFARQLVKEDLTLLVKKSLLAKKTSQSLGSVGIFKRGGKELLSEGTVLKAFSNVTLG